MTRLLTPPRRGLGHRQTLRPHARTPTLRITPTYSPTPTAAICAPAARPTPRSLSPIARRDPGYTGSANLLVRYLDQGRARWLMLLRSRALSAWASLRASAALGGRSRLDASTCAAYSARSSTRWSTWQPHAARVGVTTCAVRIVTGRSSNRCVVVALRTAHATALQFLSAANRRMSWCAAAQSCSIDFAEIGGLLGDPRPERPGGVFAELLEARACPARTCGPVLRRLDHHGEAGRPSAFCDNLFN